MEALFHIFAGLFGFAGPFVPRLIQFFERRQDNAHERAMIELEMSRDVANHGFRVEELNVNADIADMTMVRQPMQSMGVSLLDAAPKSWSAWAIGPVFYMYALLDLIKGLVRPAITYYVVGLWSVVKFATIRAAQAAGDLDVFDAVKETWGDQDTSVLILVLAFWFGTRAAQRAFGQGQ